MSELSEHTDYQSIDIISGVLAGPLELTPDLAAEIAERIERGEPLDPKGRMSGVVADFTEPGMLDPYEVSLRVAACSPALAHLMRAEVGVDEGYRLHEHNQAVLGGLERDYVPDFPDPEDKKLLRTVSTLQDIGKSLCAGLGHHRYSQTGYNAQVAANVLDTVHPAVLDDAEKRFIHQIVGQDIMGSAVKMATFETIDESCTPLEQATEELRALQDACPPQFQDRLRDVLLPLYIADVTAYTSHRSYVDADTGERQTCQPALDRLFEQRADGLLQFKAPEARQVIDHLLAQL